MNHLEKRPLTNSSRNRNDEQEPVVLQPVHPKLAGSRPSKRFRLAKPNRSQLNMLAVLAVLAATVAFWFLVPRDWVSPDNGIETTSNNGSTGSGTNRSDREVATPFKDAQQERAREAVRGIINDFTEYQDVLEKNQYGTALHLERYSKILARANNGDQLFSDRKFDDAQREYEIALQEIEELLEDMSSEFTHWFEQGDEALQQRDYETSLGAFERAQAIEPLNQQVHAKLERVRLLPRVNELVRESERAKLKEDWVQALDYLNEVMQVDPLTQSINERREVILEQISSQDLKDALTAGHEQLSAENFDEAEQIFNDILVKYPQNIAAQTGVDQVGRERLAAKIESLRVRALEKENELDMRGALKIYDEALELDGSLQFANEGRQRVFEIISVINDMNAMLRDPHALSSDETFEEAKETLETAQSHRGHSDVYDELLNSFAELVNYSGSQLTVVLLSDNATEVTLTTSHRIGLFERHELSLRPGRYTLHGSRDGWVDIRKTFIVRRDMDPVSIVCEERI